MKKSIKTMSLTDSEQAKSVNEVYEKPMIEIIEMEPEGVLCGSAEGWDGGGGYNGW